MASCHHFVHRAKALSAEAVTTRINTGLSPLSPSEPEVNPSSETRKRVTSGAGPRRCFRARRELEQAEGGAEGGAALGHLDQAGSSRMEGHHKRSRNAMPMTAAKAMMTITASMIVLSVGSAVRLR